jgi:hypothetical protein
MIHVRTRWLMAALLLLLSALPAPAQTSTTEFLREIDAYVRLNSTVRFAFQAKETIASQHRGVPETVGGAQAGHYFRFG